jgi:hypothetical protein
MKLEDGMRELLRPLVTEIVREEVTAAIDEHLRKREDTEYLTTAEYARRFKTTSGAVLARINRGTLKATKPSGAREWLIPVNGGPATTPGSMLSPNS